MATHDLFRTIDTRYGRLTIFANDSGAVSQSLVRYGEWAENELSFLHAMIDQGATVLDIGAYIGTHALAFARFVGPSGHVVAIEPQTSTFKVLKGNIELNGAGNVRLVHAVASFEIRDAMIPSIDIEQSKSFGSASLLDALPSIEGGLAAHPLPHQANDLAVRLTTVDALGVPNCALIKIDVEGMEDLVLRGAEETIRRSSPIIYAECNSLERGLRSVETLRALGYRVLAHVVSAYNPDNFLKNKRNVFGGAREIALVAVAGSNLERIERYKVRPCEMLLVIETADDLALALLNKPQYEPEVLRATAAAKSGGALHLDEVDAIRLGAETLRDDLVALRRRTGGNRRSADVIERAGEIKGLIERLDQTDAALAEAQSLAIERAQEIKRLGEQLDRTDSALVDTQRLAVERARENKGLSEKLDGTSAALAEAQSLAIERAQEIKRLGEQLDRTDAALVDTQRLAVERARENKGLSEKLDGTSAALAEAQSLAIERAQEIMRLSEQLDRTDAALAEAQSLAIERAQEIKRLSEQLDRTDAALVDTQRLAVERARENKGLSEKLDGTSAALAEAQSLAIERAQEIMRLSEQLDRTDAALAEAQSLAIERAQEIKRLSEQLDRTDAALVDTQRLAVERAWENKGLSEKLDGTSAALAEAQSLAIERAQEIKRLSEQLDRTDAALVDTQRLAVERAGEIKGLCEQLDRIGMENDRSRQECERQQARAMDAEAALASVYASRSWCFTAPIRATAKLLGRARDR